MNERINKLLIDRRIQGLMATEGMEQIISKLIDFKKRHNKLSDSEIELITRAEREIETIDVHVKKMWVEGRMVDVTKITKG